jgi:hypothetical protein
MFEIVLVLLHDTYCTSNIGMYHVRVHQNSKAGHKNTKKLQGKTRAKFGLGFALYSFPSLVIFKKLGLGHLQRYYKAKLQRSGQTYTSLISKRQGTGGY